MPATAVKSSWESGNLVFRDKSGNEILTIDGANRKVSMPAAAEFTVGAVDIIDELQALSGLDSGELGVLNGVTAGTVTASKAAVVDANKDIGDFRNVDVVNLDAGASGTAGTVDVFPTTASKGKLVVQCADNTTDHNVILTNAPANGAHATVTLPALTGYAAVSTAALTLAEVDVLDAVTAGTAAASKAVVLDANAHIDAVKTAALHIGATGAEVQVTATAAELNYCDVAAVGTVEASKAAVVDANKDIGDFRNLDAVNIDAGASGAAGTVDVFPSTASMGKLSITAADSAGDTTTTIVNASQADARTYTIPDAGASAEFVMNAGAQTIAGVKTFSSSPVLTAGVGAAAGTGVVAVETGFGNFKTTTLTLTNTPVVLADEAGQIAYGGLKVYDFPQGYVYMQSAVADLAVTKSSAGVNDDWDGDWSMGTATAGNDADLTGTEQNILPKTATPQAAAGATTADGVSTATEHAIHDGTSAAIDAFVNFLVDDADHDVTSTPCNLLLNGTITINWLFMGDN